jgi:hypothetical protein
LRVRLSEESYRVSSILSTDWRVDLVVASSDGQQPEPVVQLKLVLDTQPHQGPMEASITVDGDRVREMAFEMDGNKLDVLIRELAHAQSLMESIEN